MLCEFTDILLDNEFSLFPMLVYFPDWVIDASRCELTIVRVLGVVAGLVLLIFSRESCDLQPFPKVLSRNGISILIGDLFLIYHMIQTADLSK